MKTSLLPSPVNLKRPLLFILACWVIFCFEVFVFQPRPVVLQNVPADPQRPSLHHDGRLANISRGSRTPLLLSDASKRLEEDTSEAGSQLSPSEDYLVTAILPVTLQSLPSLHQQFSTLLQQPLYLHEILLLCQPAHQAQTRRVLFNILSEDAAEHQVDISIFNWPSHLQEGAALIYAAQHVDISPDRILFLGTDSLEVFESETLAMLVGRFATPLPVGPRGFSINDGGISCLSANSSLSIASFLVPPFSVAPLLIPPHDLSSDPIFDIWASLGRHISRARHEGIGGIIVDFNQKPSWCPSDKDDSSHLQQQNSPATEVESPNTNGIFVVILPSLDDLLSVASLVCRLWSNGHDVKILLTDGNISTKVTMDSGIPRQPSCALRVESLRSENSSMQLEAWLGTLLVVPDVILTIPAMVFSSELSPSCTVVKIPREDLTFCDWMSTLSLEAWKNWNKPQLEVSVITNDRPDSLSRLLLSLSQSSFFGDTIHLRINVEQGADENTLRLVNSYEWKHGAKYIHRRVVQGGLLPAVVESWYPSSNDSYGLMLEDDVELSPLFYAWIKMTLLTYRYGRPEDISPGLFGISLYQQKNLELRPEGRHLFNAQKLFSAASYSHVNTPYLSQIPCSWGAVYFPEQWREFHDYLSVRLSGTHQDLQINQIVAPGLRSNKWTRSWKKYFIELVYLRGYVMLYPNFGDYLSLSTNHLEVGSHVREMSHEAYERKKKLYLLPLMERSGVHNSDDVSYAPSPATTGLLDLPEERLPCWNRLPVLDLLGLVTTEESIQERGASRREEMFKCAAPNRPLDVKALLCVPTTT